MRLSRALLPFVTVTSHVSDSGCCQLGSQSEDDTDSPKTTHHGAKERYKALWFKATESWELFTSAA